MVELRAESSSPRFGPNLLITIPAVKRNRPAARRVRPSGKKWLEEKHKNKAKRKSWRKLHHRLDLVSGEIDCSELTRVDIGDPTALPDLLDQVDGPVDLFLAVGAYDGSSTRYLLVERFGAMIEIAIPPPKTLPLARTRRCIRQRATG